MGYHNSGNSQGKGGKTINQSRKGKGGYFFLETMAALVIVVILLSPLLEQTEQSVQAQQAQDNRLIAALMAKGYLERLLDGYQENNRQLKKDIIEETKGVERENYSSQVNWLLLEENIEINLYQVEVSYIVGEEKVTYWLRLAGEK